MTATLNWIYFNGNMESNVRWCLRCLLKDLLSYFLCCPIFFHFQYFSTRTPQAPIMTLSTKITHWFLVWYKCASCCQCNYFFDRKKEIYFFCSMFNLSMTYTDSWGINGKHFSYSWIQLDIINWCSLCTIIRFYAFANVSMCDLYADKLMVAI